MSIGFEELLPLMEAQFSAGNSITFTPNGSSMEPLFRSGRDKVTLSPAEPTRGSLLFFRREDGRFVLHRAIRKAPDGWIVRGDNQWWTEHVPSCRILAVVTAYVRKGKEHRTGDLFDRAFFFFLPVIRLTHRCARKCRRILHGKV